jgi:hypothetical protein
MAVARCRRFKNAMKSCNFIIAMYRHSLDRSSCCRRPGVNHVQAFVGSFYGRVVGAISDSMRGFERWASVLDGMGGEVTFVHVHVQ